METNTVEPSPVGYRAIYPWAIASVPVGALSILTLFSWYLAIIPLAGIWIGWRALITIRRAPELWTGKNLARLGIWLSLGFWAIGYGWLIFARSSEVPYGYQWVDYEALQPDPNSPAEPIPQSALDLQDKRIYIKGFMQPRRQQTRIKEFILCPSTGECNFCTPNPTSTELIRVILQGDLETIYTTRMIGVGGRFQVDSANLAAPYSIEADYIR